MEVMLLIQLRLVAAVLILIVAQTLGVAVSAARPHKHVYKHAHPGDPVRQEEHSALVELVADENATHIAIANGVRGDAITRQEVGSD